jgi:hypothetical protein
VGLMFVPGMKDVASVLCKAATPAMGLTLQKARGCPVRGLPSSTRITPTCSGSPNR